MTISENNQEKDVLEELIDAEQISDQQLAAMEEEGEGLPSEGVAVRLLKPVTVERLAQVVAQVLKEDQIGP